MVAELAPRPAVLPLLIEPDAPGPDDKTNRIWHGYRYTETASPKARCHDDDEHGALIQHAICRYLVHGVQRQQIAREVGYSERQVQAWFRGAAWESYSRPVLRELSALGIGLNRGGSGGTSPTEVRLREIIEAQRQVIWLAAALLMNDTRPGAERLRSQARLLMAGREPLG